MDAEVAGAVIHARSKSGNVRVRGRLAEGEHSLESGYGDLTLAVPADSSFRLDAATKYGGCKCAFALQAEGKNDGRHLRGTVGADPKTVLKLATNSGNVEVRKE